MKRFLIGHSPFTTLAGYVLSALLIIQQLQDKGVTDWHQMILPVAIAIFGRIAGDDHPRSAHPAQESFTDRFSKN